MLGHFDKFFVQVIEFIDVRDILPAIAFGPGFNDLLNVLEGLE